MEKDKIKISTALVSVYNKTGLKPVIDALISKGISIISTGGTQEYIESLGYQVTSVESLTDYPSIFGGRVKTLHPKVFGGILYRRDNEEDVMELKQYGINPVDLVIVDLYPFADALRNKSTHNENIEKIDIGGISLIRAAAKNYENTLVIPSVDHYDFLIQGLNTDNGFFSMHQRKHMAAEAFRVSASYDTLIGSYLGSGDSELPLLDILPQKPLRYGENPHQKARFLGNINDIFEKLNGKELSYNNLVDIEAAVSLVNEFNENPAFVIIKHTNPCGVAEANSVLKAWKMALECDPQSAFGGIIASNRIIDKSAAKEIDKLFFEVIIAPEFDFDALDILKSKKNRIILNNKVGNLPMKELRSVLSGFLWQDKDLLLDDPAGFVYSTENKPDKKTLKDLLFSNKIVKHAKSNAITLSKNGQLMGIGHGQTSRVKALEHAIEKANEFGLSLKGAVMASDAFFPFKDCVELASKAGIVSIIQPGGSVRDNESIEACNEAGISMVFTGKRHFKH